MAQSNEQKKLNVKISKLVRINAKQFIQWLQEAEVEEEDDDLKIFS